MNFIKAPNLSRLISVSSILATSVVHAGSKSDTDPLRIQHTADFLVNGKGDNPVWDAADWIELDVVEEVEDAYHTHAKILHSDTGLYFLFDCEDKVLISVYNEDHAEIYRGDVVELFLWTDKSVPIYFEYELSPLNVELVLMVPNMDGKFHGWLPWRYAGDRQTRHETHVRGGERKDGSEITGWSAEIYIPYVLLKPLRNVPPEPGSTWRMNLYRMDKDSGENIRWAWQPIDNGFHEINNFGTVRFEPTQ